MAEHQPNRVPVNTYAEGRVTSLSFTHENGRQASVGVFLPGEYTFTPDKWEYVQILSGELHLADKLLPFTAVPEEDSLTTTPFLPPLRPGVPFTIRCEQQVAYLCIYSDADDLESWANR